MGLDITAYSGLAATTEGNGESFELSETILKFTEKHWLGRTKGLTPGRYVFSDLVKFRAGSYSGYNQWRDWLARLVGFKDAEDCWDNGTAGGPFYELINFANNKGVIGPVVAAKLAKDFEHWETKAESFSYPERYNIEKYRGWAQACKLAANQGAIDFH